MIWIVWLCWSAYFAKPPLRLCVHHVFLAFSRNRRGISATSDLVQFSLFAEQRRKRRATALANSADLRKAVITKYLKSHILAATDGLNSEAENLLPKVRKLPAALTQLNSFDELFRLDDDLNLTKVNNDVTETETSGLESNDEESEQEQLLNIDIDSAEFKALKYEAQHEILMSIRYVSRAAYD